MQTFEELMRTKGGHWRKMWSEGDPQGNAKAQKGLLAGKPSAIHYMAPATKHKKLTGSRKTLCPNAGSCVKTCLNVQGHMGAPTAQESHLAKAAARILYPERYIQHAHHSLQLIRPDAHARWSGTSDDFNGLIRLPAIYGKTLAEANPKRVFEEYTRLSIRAWRNAPPNVKLCYSLNEKPNSVKLAGEYLRAGHSVAIVVGPSNVTRQGITRRVEETKQAILDHGELFGWPVSDGDEHDWRSEDAGKIVLLKAKGSARWSLTSFIVRFSGTNITNSPVLNGLKL